jgi:CheY-like chemotaxis protein
LDFVNPFPVHSKNILLADDDADDCLLFEDALREVTTEALLTKASDGQQLMSLLSHRTPPVPDVIFLDLNIPRKNGFECLREIRENPLLRTIPIVIFSTSSQPEAVESVYRQGADFYICKPESFPLLIKAIQMVLSINWEKRIHRTPKEKFVLSLD